MKAFTTLLAYLFVSSYAVDTEDVKVLTVATDDHPGLERYLRSAKIYDIEVEVLGKGQKWTGGDMNFPGGGVKVNLLRKKIHQMMKRESPDTIILFTDSYDVMFLGDLESIVKRFEQSEARVLFSAEPFCWPDIILDKKYPKGNNTKPYPYLNSGAFIGYLNELAEILDYKSISDKDDDQLYYTKVFLDPQMREGLKIKLDHNGTLFQNLNGALSDVELQFNTTEDWPYIENTATNQRPLIVHGNGPSKVLLNQYGSYLAKSWSMKKGCALCKEKRIKLKEPSDNYSLPTVMLAVFIEQPTPFIEDFFDQIQALDYPKKSLHLVLRNNAEYHEAFVEKFFNEHKDQYASAKRLKPSDFMTEGEARNVAVDRCKSLECDYIFTVDSVARIQPRTLMYLIKSGYDVVAPLLVRPDSAWSNFWGALDSEGYYARSSDYMDIVKGNILGIWNVPFITACYLVKMSVLRNENYKSITYIKKKWDPDMAFCISLRDLGLMMYVSNEKSFGHLVDADKYPIDRTHPDMYELLKNRVDWERHYLHPDYSVNFEEDRKHLMPCPDVYWFPLMSMKFCTQWIEIMEAFGKWSDGSNKDSRLEGGYEAVPTRDIHMTQVGLNMQWLQILKDYVRPLQEKVFTGYYHNPPVSLMNFVVRYRPDEQPSLRPHHDSSTYTINLALNTPHVDYEGGGCRFIRYNCSVRDTKPGWVLMHPGRLTHFHEGLLVTNGTRYIMISFVDP